MNIYESLKDTRAVIDSLLTDAPLEFASQPLPNPLEQTKLAAQACVDALLLNKKIFFMGNGGSAAEAQHLAGELVSFFMKQSKP